MSWTKEPTSLGTTRHALLRLKILRTLNAIFSLLNCKMLRFFQQSTSRKAPVIGDARASIAYKHEFRARRDEHPRNFCNSILVRFRVFGLRGARDGEPRTSLRQFVVVSLAVLYATMLIILLQ